MAKSRKAPYGKGLLVAEKSKTLLKNIKSDYQAFQAGCDNLISVLRGSASTPGEVVVALDASTLPYDSIISSIQDFSDFFDQATDEQAVAAVAHAAFVTKVIIVGIIIAVVIATTLSLYIARIISKPVNIMMGLLKQAGETGNLMFTDEELQRAKEVMMFKDKIS